MKRSCLLAWGVAVGPWSVVVGVAPGCQPDSPPAAQQLVDAESELPGRKFESVQPDGDAQEVGVGIADREQFARQESDEIRTTAAEFETGAVESPAAPATKRKSPQQHYEQGLASEQAGNTGDAIAHYTAALELDPSLSPARKQLGALLLKLNRYVDASILYGELVERAPGDPDARNDWGVVLIRIGHLSEAIVQFREALQLKADHPDAHYNLAVALLDQGKVTESIEHLIEALRIQPSYTDAHFTLGRAYLQQGKLDGAVAQLQHVMQLDREYKGLDYQLGRAHIRQGNLKKAVLHFSEAVRHDPFHFEARYALGLALAKYGNQAGAISQFTEAVRLEPESPDAHLQLALVLARVGRTAEAIVHNDMALSLRPDWPDALNNQAWLLATTDDQRLRDPKRALELAARAKTLADFKMPLVLDTLAAAQAANGEFDQAQQSAAKAAEWAAGTDQAHMAGEIEQRLEKYRNGHSHTETPTEGEVGDEVVK